MCASVNAMITEAVHTNSSVPLWMRWSLKLNYSRKLAINVIPAPDAIPFVKNVKHCVFEFGSSSVTWYQSVGCVKGLISVFVGDLLDCILSCEPANITAYMQCAIVVLLLLILTTHLVHEHLDWSGHILSSTICCLIALSLSTYRHDFVQGLNK